MAARRRKRPPFPWIVFLLLVGSVYLFWFSPKARKPKPAEVTFSDRLHSSSGE